MKQYNTEPSLINILNDFQEKIFNNLNCHQIGKIIKFYKEDQTADINICFKKEVINLKTNTLETKDYTLLLKCPVMGTYITYPVKEGDYCLVCFNDCNIDSWFENVDNQIPYSIDRHCINDGIAIVGLNNLITKFNDYETERVNIRNNTLISGDLEVNNIQANQDVNIDGSEDIKQDLTVQGNIEGATYSTNQQAGVSGVFTNTDGGSVVQTMTIVNGLVVNIS